VADVDDDQERRPAVVDRQVLGVAFGLTSGALHGGGPALGAAHRSALPGFGLGAAKEAN
jgi:hypothetical protein